MNRPPQGRVRRGGKAYPFARVMEQATAALKGSLPPDELEEAWQRGAAMTLDDAIALALDRD